MSWTERSPAQAARETGLLTIRLSDRKVRALLPGRIGRFDNPAFSPNGRRLAFLIAHPNRLTAGLAMCEFDRGSTASVNMPITASDFPLSWSRDSSRLLFLGGDLTGYGADMKPYLVHLGTGQLQNLGGDAPWYWDGAALSPDNRNLALLLALKDPNGQEPEKLVVYDPTAQNTRRIVGSYQVAEIDAMSWSPDGMRIAFCAYKHDPHGDLYVVDVATKKVKMILGTAAGERRPAWSPDDKWIAYERSPRRHPGETSIWMVNVKTGGTERVTWGHADVSPSWSPDSKQIVFVRRR